MSLGYHLRPGGPLSHLLNHARQSHGNILEETCRSGRSRIPGTYADGTWFGDPPYSTYTRSSEAMDMKGEPGEAWWEH